VTEPENAWLIPVPLAELDTGLEAALLGRIADKLGELDMEQQREIAHRICRAITQLVAAVGNNFIPNVDAQLNCQGYPLELHIPSSHQPTKY